MVLQTHYINSHSHQQGAKVWVSSHPAMLRIIQCLQRRQFVSKNNHIWLLQWCSRKDEHLSM